MNLVVIGAQWGDEGKGKIVDFLASDADLIVRFSGGANAGHTIVTEEDTYKLHLIPSGIIYPKKKVVLGSAMVIDPKAMFEELEMLTEKNIDWKDRIFISDRAHIVLPGYRELDKKMDSKRKRPIGTTGRGIGITYAKKANRDGIRIGDLFEPELINDLDPIDKEFILPYIEKIKPMVVEISSLMAKYKDKKVLFEGAQGILLDLDIGTYPFVSSGQSAAAGACSGGGIGPRDIDSVLGVFKAYTTRVGNGPFPSEFQADRDGDLESTIREIGREYGVTTGRPRRCGYLDLVALKYACRTNSIDNFVLTHLDVYDEMDELKACVAYEYKGKELTEFPTSIEVLNNSKPITKTFKGWKTSLADAQDVESMPQEAKDYLKFIEDYTESKIGIVSVGYKRKQTILRKNPWTKS